MSNVKCQMSNGWFVSVDKPDKCPNCTSEEFDQDNDTFDTWFSSAQWPFATLQNEFFNYYYPTSVMETGYDILPWWVARMIMIGYFVTKEVPFKTIFLHGMVRDKQGQKMSKSKGNVINPIEMINKYGADALRAALLFGVKEGNDLVLSEDKIVGMRNFTNKVWNIGRFIDINKNPNVKAQMSNETTKKILGELEKEFKEEKKKYQLQMKNYRLSKALDMIYHFLWHRLADYYIEELKEALKNGNIEALKVLESVYLDNLVMLHPFMPFVTEAIWQVFKGKDSSILEISS
jgi:valyl-tRNA synthetase